MMNYNELNITWSRALQTVYLQLRLLHLHLARIHNPELVGLRQRQECWRGHLVCAARWMDWQT